MEEQFTEDKIDLIVKVARILAPGFTPEQYQALLQSQEEFGKTGFCEACWAVTQLHQQRDILYEEAVPAIEALLHQKTELEGVVSKLETERTQLQEANRQAQTSLQQTKVEIRQVQKELRVLKDKYQETERELQALQEKMEKEKERLNQELDACQVQAGVTHSEIENARELKTEFQKKGFGLELALSLCTELGKYANPESKLNEALQKYGSLQKYLVSLNEWGESQKKSYQSQIQDMKGNCSKLANDLAQQQAQYTHGELLIQQQNQQLHDNADILNLYHKYQPLRGLIDYLGKFAAAGFYHCTWCGVRYWILDFGSTSRNQTCLWCNLPMVDWDNEAYKVLDRKPGLYKLIP